jgi:hypothetical protein
MTAQRRLRVRGLDNEREGFEGENRSPKDNY